MIIGVTGGIASGKSTVCSILESMGFIHIDADEVAHDVLEIPEVIGDVTAVFGNEILIASDDRRSPLRIDRKALGKIVFNDPAGMETLERITHPIITRIIKERVQNDPGRDYVIEAIALVSSGIYEILDELWVVYAEPEVQIRRLMETRGMSRADAEDRLKSQEEHDWNEENTTRVIYSTEPIETMVQQIRDALKQCYD